MQRDIMWSPVHQPGLEHLRLVQNHESILADGLIIGMEDNQPFRLTYEIRCDAGWRVREVRLMLLGDNNSRVHLLTDGEGRWTTSSGKTISMLDGCIDVDISATPFTNTLPIRRLPFQVGEAAEITVVYIAVPEMELRTMRQRYSCLELNSDGGLYRYESVVSGFTAEISVDADGLVVDYPGVFRRVMSLPSKAA